MFLYRLAVFGTCIFFLRTGHWILKISFYSTNQPILVWTNSAQPIQPYLLQLSCNATGIDGPLDGRGNIIVNLISYKVIGIQDVRGPKGFILDRTAKVAKNLPKIFLSLENDFENFYFYASVILF